MEENLFDKTEPSPKVRLAAIDDVIREDENNLPPDAPDAPDVSDPPKRTDKFTEGSLWKNIFVFSLPLIFSQVLQVLFNMSDVAVVGKFASSDAMGSVGSTTTLVTLFTGFLIGLGAGINVKVAQFLGAKRDKDVEETVHTSFLISLIAGAIVCVACFFLGRIMLVLLETNAELLDGAVLYFKIYALGMPALAVFNFASGVLSAKGDTKRPLIYLTISGILNVFLNLFFVIICKMQAEGVAYASIISQYISAVLVMVRLIKQKDSCKFSFKKLKISGEKAKAVLTLGLSAGVQNALFAIANLFVQNAVNSFDKVVVNGNAAASNADSIVYNVMAAFYTACSTFIGQNLGAGKRDRILKCYFISLAYSAGFGLVIGLFLVFFGRLFLFFFTNEEEVVVFAMERLRVMGLSYFISALVDSAIAASRGLGKSLVPTIILVLGTCVFRIVWIYTIFAYFRTIPSLYLLYAASWIVTSTAETIYFFTVYKKLMKTSSLEHWA